MNEILDDLERLAAIEALAANIDLDDCMFCLGCHSQNSSLLLEQLLDLCQPSTGQGVEDA